MSRNSNPRRMRIESLETRAMLHGTPVAQFSLVDVNETSETFNQAVSPSDYTGKTTGWYFGHST